MREKLPRITVVKPVKDLRLSLRFDDGWKTTVDLRDFVAGFKSLAPLTKPSCFAKAELEEWGSGVTWDNEGPLSIAATTLYRLAAEQTGTDAQCFDAWMMGQWPIGGQSREIDGHDPAQHHQLPNRRTACAAIRGVGVQGMGKLNKASRPSNSAHRIFGIEAISFFMYSCRGSRPSQETYCSEREDG